MISFSTELEAQLLTIANNLIGPGTDLTHTVLTFDDHLRDVDQAALPFLCLFVREADADDNVIGSAYDLKTYQVFIYYMDIRETWAEGKAKRDAIMSRFEKGLKKDRRLGNFESVDPDSTREYVFDSKISSVLFDTSGQDEYYTFICQMFLNVMSDTN